MPQNPENPDFNHNGEAPDGHALSFLGAVHGLAAKFPEVSEKYKKFLGTTVVLSAAGLGLFSLAVHIKLQRGTKIHDVIAQTTDEDISEVIQKGNGLLASNRPQPNGSSRFHIGNGH